MSKPEPVLTPLAPPTPYTANGTINGLSMSGEIIDALQRLTYGYEFIKGHRGELGELRISVKRGGQVLPGRTKKQSMELINTAIERFHERAKREGLVSGAQKLLYVAQRALQR